MSHLGHDSSALRILSYRDLLVWQRSMDLCEAVYRVSRRLPRSELFGLADQMRRASVSIASNIAEGHARSHTGEYLHQLTTARGSIAELETQLIICVRVDYFPEREVTRLLRATDEVGRMLSGLRSRLRARDDSPERRRRR
jgi:four helix bundle protein